MSKKVTLFVGPDTTPPAVSNKSLSASSITDSGFIVDFNQATDEDTPQQNLVYKVYTGDIDDFLSTPEEMIASGIFQSQDKGTTSLGVSNIFDDRTYQVNVLVEDRRKNRSSYSSFEVTTKLGPQNVQASVSMSAAVTVSADTTSTIPLLRTVQVGGSISASAAFQGGADSREGDELALESLYSSTNGGNWTSGTSGWSSSGMSLSNSIAGVTVATIGGELRVTSVNINANGATGSLPVELGNLKQCTIFDVEGNSIGGPIPVEIGNMLELVELWLGGNQSNKPDFGSAGYHPGKIDSSSTEFTGTFPQEIFNLPKLEILRCERQGSLTGTLDGLGNCTTLRAFLIYGEFLDYTSGFTGGVPAGIGNLTDLIFFSCGRNAISGSIPDEIGNCTSLRYFEIAGSNITDFPSTMTNCPIKHFWCDRIKLDMPWPDWAFEPNVFPELTTFTFVWPKDTPGFTGTMEGTDFNNVTDLDQLGLASHSLTGEIPDSIVALDAVILTLHFLDRNNAGFEGEVPQTGWDNWVKCRHVRFAGNNLQGPIPTELAQVTSGSKGRDQCSFHENRLVPDDIIPAIEAGVGTNWDNFSYDEQKPFGQAEEQVVAPGGTFSKDYSGKLSHSDNEYLWEKDADGIAGETSSSITINNVQASDAGEYVLRVTSNYPGINQTFFSKPVTLIVE